MAAAARPDLDPWPAGADATDYVAQHQCHLGPVGRLARAQDNRHWLTGRRLVNVDRQQAAAVVMGIEQCQLLSAVNPVLGIVNVEQDAPGYLLEAVARTTRPLPPSCV